MLTIRNDKVLYGSRVKIGHISLLALVLVLLTSACSNAPATVQKQYSVNENITEKGPYETDVMNQPSIVSYEAPDDPLRFINEPIFIFNDNTYRYVLSPIASGYEKVVPKIIDTGISNFFYNLREPIYTINHLLQGNWYESGDSFLRLLINTTLGLAGLFDPANDLVDIKRNKATFGNTLASYGVGHGAYLVLPFLGPSDLRDTGSIAFNYFVHPLNYLDDENLAWNLIIFDGVQAQVPVLAKYPKALEKVENKYEFIRNLYMQNIQRDGHEKRNEAFQQLEKDKEGGG